MRRIPRRPLATGLAGGILAVLLAGAPVSAQVPVPTELPPLPWDEPSEDPSAGPSEPAAPSASEEPSAAPSEGATGGQPNDGTAGPDPRADDDPEDPELADDGTTEPTDVPSGGGAALPGFGLVEPDGSASAVPAGEPVPEVAPSRAADGRAPGSAGPARSVAAPLGVDRVAAAIPGSFAIALLAALLGVGTMTGTLSLTRRGLVLATDVDGGTDVDMTRRWRVMAGVALLAAAALVGILGYLKISIETLVPVQMVYMASAGFGVIVLAAAGGALLIAEQLRTDERRLTEIESALVMIAEHLRPDVADAPRLVERDPRH